MIDGEQPVDLTSLAELRGFILNKNVNFQEVQVGFFVVLGSESSVKRSKE